jgi:putative ABC transport system permease protein
MSGCFVLALAAVLAPMMVLFGLKFGIVTSMVDKLVEDPRNREIRSVGSGRFHEAWFDALRSRADVAFVVPRTRTISATMKLYKPEAGRIVSVELIPSTHGDPLLVNVGAAPEGLNKILLSSSAAQKLEVSVGDIIEGSLARRFGGRNERQTLNLEVVGIAEPAAFPREAAFVTVQLAVVAEEYRDGRAVPALGWSGAEPASNQRSFPGYRLYARSIYDVAQLSEEFAAQGLEVRTSAADIDIVQSMERNLSVIFWIIALVGLIGFSVSLGASLWANVDRKRRELSVLRLVGFNTGSIVWFPVLHAFFTGLMGWILAGFIYLGVQQSINQLFLSQLARVHSICRLLPEHFLIALGITLGSAVLAAALAGYRASLIEPSEGLREI